MWPLSWEISEREFPKFWRTIPQNYHSVAWLGDILKDCSPGIWKLSGFSPPECSVLKVSTSLQFKDAFYNENLGSCTLCVYVQTFQSVFHFQWHSLLAYKALKLKSFGVCVCVRKFYYVAQAKHKLGILLPLSLEYWVTSECYLTSLSRALAQRQAAIRL